MRRLLTPAGLEESSDSLLMQLRSEERGVRIGIGAIGPSARWALWWAETRDCSGVQVPLTIRSESFAARRG